MARNWREVRGQALASGRITEEGLAQARRDHDERIQAHRLRQVRQARTTRQADVAERMQVSQSRVSRIEGGDLDHVELATLRAYVAALGGQLRITADFDGEQLTLS